MGLALTHAFGIDQGVSSGWCINRGRTPLHYGLAKNHAQRLAAVELARTLCGGEMGRLLVYFEDHSKMPLGRMGANDRGNTSLRRYGAPERSTASILGMGASKGRWLELLDLVKHPQALRDAVVPRTWRARLGVGLQLKRLSAKEEACDIASAIVGERIDDDDVAEAIGIASFAGTEGMLIHAASKGRERTERAVKKAIAAQGALAFDATLLTKERDP